MRSGIRTGWDEAGWGGRGEDGAGTKGWSATERQQGARSQMEMEIHSTDIDCVFTVW